jgi:putative ABC transport system permease protein
LPTTDYPDAARVNTFYRELLDRLGQLPGVSAAGGVRILPLSRTIGDWSIRIEGRPSAPNENPNGDFQYAAPAYFEAMGMTLVAGRWFAAADREGALPVAIVNDTMAERYWPGVAAIGKRFQMGGPDTTRPLMTIVGIVKTSRHNAILEAPRAEIYLPHAQSPESAGTVGRSMSVVLKTDADPLALAGSLRETVRALDRNLPIADMRAMDQLTAAALSAPRFASLLLGVFALLAVTLAAIGTHALISLLVAERAHEIGIRMALGAERRTILRAVLREGGAMAMAGVTIGVAGAMLFARLLESLLYGVRALDPLTFGAVAALLVSITLLATLMPARRAASIDPARALRQ